MKEIIRAIMQHFFELSYLLSHIRMVPRTHTFLVEKAVNYILWEEALMIKLTSDFSDNDHLHLWSFMADLFCNIKKSHHEDIVNIRPMKV